MGNICLEPDRKNNQMEMDDHASDHGIEEAKSGEVMERGASASSHREGKTVWNLNDKQKDDCENIFGVFEEEDEKVHVKHLGPMMRAFNYKPTDEDLKLLVERIEKECEDSRMDFQCFLQIMAPRILEVNEVYSEEKIMEAFNRFDRDHNGYISASELRIALKDHFCPGMKRVACELTDDDVQEIMHEADLDGDGLINYDEFKKMIPLFSDCIHTAVKIK